MTSPQTGSKQRLPVSVLAAAFLFNLGQGVLRPSLPVYLQRTFTANYRMVTLIPVVFGAGKWIASLPTGYLLDRFGRPLMIWGLLLIAIIDLASTAMVSVPAVQRRGRAVSLPGVLVMGVTNAVLIAIQTGVLVFLSPSTWSTASG